MENLYDALQLFVSCNNMAAIIGGVFLGVIVGGIPGLTGTMAVALALPFSFTLSPITAILLLLGIYNGSIYGGSIPAVLLKTPGTPSASCTVLDGYPLMEKGKGRQALGMALYASCIAGIISSLSLIFLTTFIAELALRFGPPEFFALICFALTIIAGVSGQSLLKGFIAASIGLLLASVGMDLVHGTNRFAFDVPELMAGLNFIPVLIGIFALPEMIMALSRTQAQTATTQDDCNDVSAADLKRCMPTILRGSCIGVILGAIPGIGAAPAAFLSYSEARRYSKHPELFGHGSLEGVAAAESGNNGVCGAAMIPLLALGVPGDVITGVILGAFMMHGVAPGPLLFAENLPLVYAIYAGFFFSVLCLFFIGKLAIRIFYRLAGISYKLVYPAVLVLCVYGVYAVNNQMFDVIVMAACGLLGYGMQRLHVPTPPFLIAFILGPLCEDNLRRSLMLSGGTPEIFIRSPICLFFWGLTLLSLALILSREWKKRHAA